MVKLKLILACVLLMIQTLIIYYVTTIFPFCSNDKKTEEPVKIEQKVEDLLEIEVLKVSRIISSSVRVSYSSKNNTDKDISQYWIWIEVENKDGTKYTGRDVGFDLLSYTSEIDFLYIENNNKKVKNIKVLKKKFRY